MATDVAARAALRAQLLAVSGVSAAAVAWENRDFTPTTGTAWIRETVLPVSEVTVATGTIERRAILQLDLFHPVEAGTVDAETLAEAIKAAFAPGSSPGGTVTVDRAESLPGRRDGAWWQKPVRITVRHYRIA